MTENRDCDNGEEMDSTLQVAKMALFLTKPMWRSAHRHWPP
jgi:hypothetical protein